MTKARGPFQSKFDKYFLMPFTVFVVVSMTYGILMSDPGKKPCRLTDFDRMEMQFKGMPLPSECR